MPLAALPHGPVAAGCAVTTSTGSAFSIVPPSTAASPRVPSSSPSSTTSKPALTSPVAGSIAAKLASPEIAAKLARPSPLRLGSMSGPSGGGDSSASLTPSHASDSGGVVRRDSGVASLAGTPRLNGAVGAGTPTALQHPRAMALLRATIGSAATPPLQSAASSPRRSLRSKAGLLVEAPREDYPADVSVLGGDGTTTVTHLDGTGAPLMMFIKPREIVTLHPVRRRPPSADEAWPTIGCMVKALAVLRSLPVCAGEGVCGAVPRRACASPTTTQLFSM